MKFLIPIGCALACLALGFLSGFSTFESIEGWYSTLKKPSFNPPNWIFGPVWSVLYLAMGIAVGLIANLGLSHPGVKLALTLFAIQMLFNVIWTPVFFGMHQILAALVIIVLLWTAILICMIKFFKLRRLSGWLLVPYLLWVSFATVLNASLWILNA
ncbi:MAG: tryptophan-rich sensory protein [Verrucomicrobiales bacterium]|nr:tryptophan-rich sensory protein [Verrucomicrobiales bacterium]